MPNYIVAQQPRRGPLDTTPFAAPVPLREQIKHCLDEWGVDSFGSSSDDELWPCPLMSRDHRASCLKRAKGTVDIVCINLSSRSSFPLTPV